MVMVPGKVSVALLRDMFFGRQWFIFPVCKGHGRTRRELKFHICIKQCSSSIYEYVHFNLKNTIVIHPASPKVPHYSALFSMHERRTLYGLFVKHSVLWTDVQITIFAFLTTEHRAMAGSISRKELMLILIKIETSCS